MTAPIRSVAVLGDGIVGLSAAAAFARALPQLRVSLVPAAHDPAALADVLPGATSAIHRFHAAIGLDEAALVRAGAVLPRLGIGFVHWGRDADPWFHVHGEHGRPAGSIAFHHYWARARRSGRALPWHRYAAAGVMAEADKFVHPVAEQGSPLATFDYGFRLDPERYRGALGTHAEGLGVDRTASRFAAAERRDEGGVAALALADGRRIEADLFIDASGPGAPLCDGGSGFEDWDAWYPCHWLTMRDAPPVARSPVDTVDATERGWRWRAPLSAQTMTGELLAAGSEGAVRLRPGRRVRPWIGNVLAIGDAALALDPLHWLPLHAAHEAILRALELLPGRDCDAVETAEYNRRTALEAERLRDFQLLHHRLAEWGPSAISPGLAHVLQQFEKRGRFPSADEDSLAADIWLAALLGLGILPRAIDPLADTIPDDVAARGMAELAEQLAPLPAQLPDYADYLRAIGAP